MKDFDEAEQQIFGLIEAADTNQTALSEAIQALHAEREALRQALRAALAAAATGGLLLAVWLATFAAVRWEMHDLQYLRGEMATQQAALDKLTRKGGRAVLGTCGDPGHKPRPCVQIDKTAGEFGNGYFVIQGY